MNDFVVFPALGYWEIDGKPVSSKEAVYGLHPRAIWRETEVARNLKPRALDAASPCDGACEGHVEEAIAEDRRRGLIVTPSNNSANSDAVDSVA